jgi:hypothetical protein
MSTDVVVFVIYVVVCADTCVSAATDSDACAANGE